MIGFFALALVFSVALAGAYGRWWMLPVGMVLWYGGPRAFEVVDSICEEARLRYIAWRIRRER